MRNQILHIFRKDVRHHWPEIVLSLAITVAYGWEEVVKYRTWGSTSNELFLMLPSLSLLVVLAWVFLILRAVQGECLVGDKQFWVTRPYEWKKLLAAKLFFVLVFFNAPLLILQVFLLRVAGYPPTSYMRGFLWLQLLWVSILVFPVATLATVTASIGQFILAILSLFLFLTIAFPTVERLMPAAGVSGLSWVPGSLELLVLVGTGVAVVLLQYARRSTARSRILLLGAAVAVPLIMLVTPYRILIERAYPQASTGQPLPVQLAFDPAKPTSLQGGHPEKNKVHVRIPLLVSGIASGSLVSVSGVLEQIQAPGEQPWSSGWHGHGMVLLAERQHTQIDIGIDKGFFERVKSAPVKLHISFALAPAHAKETTRLVAQAGPFAVPGEGRCSFSPMFQGETLCIFPLKTPYFLMSAKLDELTCAKQQKETPLPPATPLYGGNLWNAGPADFGLNPVQTTSLSFWDWGGASDPNYRPRVCPGTSLTFFTNWEDSPRFRSDLEIDGIRLADYKLNDAREDAGGFSVGVP
jgi:hypothetical protein